MILNKVCELEDFQDPEAIRLIRWLEPDLVAVNPNHPAGREHRKSWEHQHAIRGALQLGDLQKAKNVLVANAGTERLVYALTHWVPNVFAVDDYTTNPSMLMNPRAHAPFDFHPRRLRVQHMPSPVLDFEDGTFDIVFGLRFSSYVLFETAGIALLEYARVLRPGGLLVLVLDMVIDGGTQQNIRGTLLHSVDSLTALLARTPRLMPPGAIAGTAIRKSLDFRSPYIGAPVFPHVALDLEGRALTSGVVFARACMNVGERSGISMSKSEREELRSTGKPFMYEGFH